MAQAHANIQGVLLFDKNDEELPEGAKNCASAGLQLFQVFSSTSAILGLSRSCDYAAVNGQLNALVHMRRNNGLTGQSNMWGEVHGTGLAGGGTGSAGSHGAEAVQVQPAGTGRVEAEKQVMSEFPPEFLQREPATAELVVAHREASSPLEVEHKTQTFRSAEAEGFVPVRGLQVSLKTREQNDKVLVICNLPMTMVENHDGATWALKRGGFIIGPKFTTWTHEMGRLENVLMPWLDEPGKARFELEYSAHCRLKGTVKVSQGQERRQLTAVVIPGGQVTSARSHEPLSVLPGKWHDVPGLQQISVVNQQEKVLVVCTIKYTAIWSDELTRGRFTIFRDGAPLDRESFGLQSVRATQKGLKRSLVMATVDDPEAGPHIYAARAAVTTAGDDQAGVCHLEDENRQLVLVRLPGELVFGPSRCRGATTVEEDKWTEVQGLTVTATAGSGDKLLIVYNANFDPAGLNYEAYFTLFRSDSLGRLKNLGHEEQGMCSVASSAIGSSEYPVAMFTDTPGVGTHTYTVFCRTRRCDHLLEPTPVEVGPDGQLSAVLLPSKRRAGEPSAHAHANVGALDLLAAELEQAQKA